MLFTANTTLPASEACTGWPRVPAMRMPLLSLSELEKRRITGPFIGHCQPRRVTDGGGGGGLRARLLDEERLLAT